MQTIFDIELLHAALRLATPLLFAAMAGVLSERAGVVNIALEGMLLLGAFFGVVAAHATGHPWLGVAGAAAAGGVAGALHGLLTLRGRVDHVISGLGINLLALGDFRAAPLLDLSDTVVYRPHDRLG